MYRPYQGNRLNAAEQSRFDFPQRTYAGQPLGVLKTGSTEKKTILLNVEPSYLPNPTHDALAATVTGSLAMPQIKGSPQQNQDSGSQNGSPGKRDREAYLERLAVQTEQRQHQIALSDAQKQHYLQKHQHPPGGAGMSLDNFNQAMLASGTSGLTPVGQNSYANNGSGVGTGHGGGGGGAHGASLTMEAEALQAKRRQQAEHAKRITEDAARKSIPEGHAILLHTPLHLQVPGLLNRVVSSQGPGGHGQQGGSSESMNQYSNNQYAQMIAQAAQQQAYMNNDEMSSFGANLSSMSTTSGRGGAHSNSILNGQGEVEFITPEQKKQQQEEYVRQIEQGMLVQQQAQLYAIQEAEAGKPPRQRASSPPIPIPGQNGLSNLGARDSPQSKAYRMEEAKQLLQEQSALVRQYQSVQQAAQPNLLRTSDDYGLMSGRVSKSGAGSPQQQGKFSSQGQGDSGQFNGAGGGNSMTGDNSGNFSAPGYHPKVIPQNRTSVPERDPNAYFPSPSVREAHERAAAAAAQTARQISLGNMYNPSEPGNTGRNGDPSSSLAEENREQRKIQQRQYQDALDSDRHAPAPGSQMGRIQLSNIGSRAANNRNEQVLFSPVKPGPNVIDLVGNYEVDRRDPMKKREFAETYANQLKAAQAAVLPIGSLQPRAPLSAQHNSNSKYNAQAQLNPFNESVASHQMKEELRSHGNNSLSISGNSPYSGFARSGFYANGIEAHEAMRAAEIEKMQQFHAAAQEANQQQPIYSPRKMLFRKKNNISDGGPDDVKAQSSQPYGLLASALERNEDTLAEKGVSEGLKKLAQAQRVAQLQQDERIKQQTRSIPVQRVPLKSPRYRSKEEMEQDIVENTVPGGLPMFNQYDWNQNALDYTWNSNQIPDRVGAGQGSDTGRQGQHFPLPHATHHMYFAQNGQGDSTQLAHPSARQDQINFGSMDPDSVSSEHRAEQRHLQYAENQPQNVSLQMYPLDVEKVHRMQSQAAYKEGLLSDRTIRAIQLQEQQQQQQQQQQQGGSRNNQMPQLQIKQQIPIRNMNQHNPNFGGQGIDNVSGVSSLANGRQPQVPAYDPVQRSTTNGGYHPDTHRMVAGQMANSGRGYIYAAPNGHTPQKTGFALISTRR